MNKIYSSRYMATKAAWANCQISISHNKQLNKQKWWGQNNSLRQLCQLDQANSAIKIPYNPQSLTFSSQINHQKLSDKLPDKKNKWK